MEALIQKFKNHAIEESKKPPFN